MNNIIGYMVMMVITCFIAPALCSIDTSLKIMSGRKKKENA